MNAGETNGEDMPLKQEQQQQEQHRSSQQQSRSKRNDEEKTSTSEQIQHLQLKPDEFDRPSRSSMSSVESMEVVHVRRPSIVTKSIPWSFLCRNSSVVRADDQVLGP